MPRLVNEKIRIGPCGHEFNKYRCTHVIKVLITEGKPWFWIPCNIIGCNKSLSISVWSSDVEMMNDIKEFNRTKQLKAIERFKLTRKWD